MKHVDWFILKLKINKLLFSYYILDVKYLFKFSYFEYLLFDHFNLFLFIFIILIHKYTNILITKKYKTQRALLRKPGKYGFFLFFLNYKS